MTEESKLEKEKAIRVLEEALSGTSGKSKNTSNRLQGLKMYLCERCETKQAMKNIKYCRECKKIVLAEFEESGYLQKVCFGHPFRGREAKENTYETKHGTGHG